MGRLHLKNVVLPSVVVACTLFSALTVPFVLAEKNPIEIRLSPVFEGEIQPIFKDNNKSFTIRYIGSALVLSVGAGLLTIEVLRRGQANPGRAFSLAQGKESFGEQAAYRNLFSEGLASAFSQTFSEADEDELDATPTTPALATTTADPDSLDLDLVADDLSAIPFLQQREALSLEPDLAANACGLVWNEECYRFFRTRQTQDKAVSIAKRLIRRGEQVVITQQEQAYAVWVREPGVKSSSLSS